MAPHTHTKQTMVTWQIEVSHREMARTPQKDIDWVASLWQAGDITSTQTPLGHTTIFTGTDRGLLPQALTALARGELTQFREVAGHDG